MSRGAFILLMAYMSLPAFVAILNAAVPNGLLATLHVPGQILGLHINYILAIVYLAIFLLPIFFAVCHHAVLSACFHLGGGALREQELQLDNAERSDRDLVRNRLEVFDPDENESLAVDEAEHRFQEVA